MNMKSSSSSFHSIWQTLNLKWLATSTSSSVRVAFPQSLHTAALYSTCRHIARKETLCRRPFITCTEYISLFNILAILIPKLSNRALLFKGRLRCVKGFFIPDPPSPVRFHGYSIHHYSAGQQKELQFHLYCRESVMDYQGRKLKVFRQHILQKNQFYIYR